MMMMKPNSRRSTAILVLLVAVVVADLGVVKAESLTCTNKGSKCYKQKITCPPECPSSKPAGSNAKACYLDCNSPTCEAVCRHRKPNCNGQGSGCYDPRFIGGDGIVFYFRGRRNEYFSLVSDPDLQINARFIGLRPAGRFHDFTWIQALGIMSGSHKFTVEAIRASQWDETVDHLQFSIDGRQLLIPEGHRSNWNTPDNKLTVERTARTNSVTIMLEGIAEISLTVAPVTKEDNRIHKYQIPYDDCFAHLEVQFKFHKLSPQVEGVLGRTYRPGFENTAKRGVAMPVVGGEDKYQTSSLLSPDCKYCVFCPARTEIEQGLPVAKS